MSSYAIVGSGGLGGFYGACLARAGHQVHFIIRDDVHLVRRQGWIVESAWGDFRLDQPNVYRDATELPYHCDFVVVAIKSTLNHLLPSLLAPLVGDSNAAIVLQNGLEVEEATYAVFGPGRVFGGCCFLCSNKVGPGHIRHLDYGRIELGIYRSDLDQDDFQNSGDAASPSSKLNRIIDDFQASKIPIERAEDLNRARWRKLMWNIPFNGLSVALNASTEEIMRNPEARQLARDLMDEVQFAAESLGYDVGATHADTLMTNTDKMVPYDSSMRLDYLAGRPMELAYIFAKPIEAAIKAGYHPPKTAMLYQQLRFLQSRNSR